VHPYIVKYFLLRTWLTFVCFVAVFSESGEFVAISEEFIARLSTAGPIKAGSPAVRDTCRK